MDLLVRTAEQIGDRVQIGDRFISEIIERGKVLYEKDQAGLGQANTLKSLGDLEKRLGHPDQARTLYDRALVLFEKEQDGLGQANTLQSLGDKTIYGEFLFCEHGARYDELPDWFIAYDLWVPAPEENPGNPVGHFLPQTEVAAICRDLRLI